MQGACIWWPVSELDGEWSITMKVVRDYKTDLDLTNGERLTRYAMI